MRSADYESWGTVMHPVHSLPGPKTVVGVAPRPVLCSSLLRMDVWAESGGGEVDAVRYKEVQKHPKIVLG